MPATELPKVLFLRTFYSDKSVVMFNPFRGSNYWLIYILLAIPLLVFGLLYLMLRPPIIKSEEFIAKVMEPHSRLRQFSGSKNTVSGPRIYATEDNWRSLVSNEVKAADIVILMPIIAEKKQQIAGLSTLWEVDQLRSTGKLANTVVLMPPGIGPRKGGIARNWQKSIEQARTLGVVLPPFEEGGMAFTLENRGGTWSPKTVYRPDTPKYKGLANALLKAFDEVAARA